MQTSVYEHKLYSIFNDSVTSYVTKNTAYIPHRLFYWNWLLLSIKKYQEIAQLLLSQRVVWITPFVIVWWRCFKVFTMRKIRSTIFFMQNTPIFFVNPTLLEFKQNAFNYKEKKILQTKIYFNIFMHFCNPAGVQLPDVTLQGYFIPNSEFIKLSKMSVHYKIFRIAMSTRRKITRSNCDRST